MRIALAGGTGLVGREVLKLALSHPEVTSVISLNRKPLLITHPKLTSSVAEFDSLHVLPSALLDAAICALGTTLKNAGSREAFYKVDHDAVLFFARWAKANGAKKFAVISSIGAHPQASTFYSKVKGEMENDLTSLGFDSLMILRPSFLLGHREEFRLGEKLGILFFQCIRPILLGRLRELRPVSSKKVSGVLLDASLHFPPGKHVFRNSQILEWEFP